MRLLILLAFAGLLPIPAAARAAPQDIRLYTLDCGQIELKDMVAFSPAHAGQSGAMAVPCYLIKHGGDWMVWDTGLGDELANHANGEVKYGGHWTLRLTLEAQLRVLGLTPHAIRYVAVSHLHVDHAGNVALFPEATWLIAPEELAWSRGKAAPFGVDPTLIAPLDYDRILATSGDVDVFGDGSVRLLKAPGHTPGHRILLLHLPHTGAVLLSGDLFHTRENYEKSLVPSVNVSRSDTVVSIKRFAAFVAREHARVVIQHAPEDFLAMPVFPAFLD
jgi:N-acyl homoserine lactone hydrolase